MICIIVRPLSCDFGLSSTDLAGVSAQQLADCINQCCDVYGYSSVERGSFQDFVVVLKQFASSNNLFLPAEEIYKQLSTLPVSDFSKSGSGQS